VTVAAATCLEANIAATAALVRGAEAVDGLAAARLPARLVRRDGSVLQVAGWPGEAPLAA
jgi:thiamine biosynthesis lipoprotein